MKYGLLGQNDYRPNQAIHEADEIYERYYHCQDSIELERIGMGKETLSLVLKWLREERHLRISKKGIIASISDEDVPEQLKKLLQSLSSNLISPIDFDRIDMTQLPIIDNDSESQGQLSFDEVIEMESF